MYNVHFEFRLELINMLTFKCDSIAPFDLYTYLYYILYIHTYKHKALSSNLTRIDYFYSLKCQLIRLTQIWLVI